jgi:hypothetical protein
LGRAPRVCRSNGGVAPVIARGLLQGHPQDPPGNGFRHTFFVTKASFVTPRFLPSGSNGSERRQVVVHPPRGRYLGLAAIPEDLACRGYCAPLLAGRRGDGPSVALRRSESRGGSGTRRGGSGTRRGAATAVGVRPGRRCARPISGPGCRGRKPDWSPYSRPCCSPGRSLGAACPSRRYVLAIFGFRFSLFPPLVFEALHSGCSQSSSPPLMSPPGRLPGRPSRGRPTTRPCPRPSRTSAGSLASATSPQEAPLKVACRPWAITCAADSTRCCTTASGGPSPCLLPTTSWIWSGLARGIAFLTKTKPP